MALILKYNELRQSCRLIAGCVALKNARCCVSQVSHLKNKTSDKKDKDRVNFFIDNLVTNKAAQWQKKTKQKVAKEVNPRVLAAIKTEIVLEEDETLAKERIYPLDILQKASVDNDFDKDQILKILESPQILAKVEPQLLEALAEKFVKLDFTEGILQLEATSQRIPTPPSCNFIGLLFHSYHSEFQYSKALALVEKYYSNFPNSRREARTYMATIIRDVVSDHSEAVLIQCKHLAMKLENQFQDCRPVIFLWHACFTSEWFSDRQVARELLGYIAKNKRMVETFDKKLMTASYSALGRHKPDLVQNLIEDLIANNLGSHLTVPIRLLFDYRCSMRDLRGCANIMKSTVDLKVMLTSKQHSDFLELLTNKKHFRWKDLPPKPAVEVDKPVEFKFKF